MVAIGCMTQYLKNPVSVPPPPPHSINFLQQSFCFIVAKLIVKGALQTVLKFSLTSTIFFCFRLQFCPQLNKNIFLNRPCKSIQWSFMIFFDVLLRFKILISYYINTVRIQIPDKPSIGIMHICPVFKWSRF